MSGHLPEEKVLFKAEIDAQEERIISFFYRVFRGKQNKVSKERGTIVLDLVHGGGILKISSFFWQSQDVSSQLYQLKKRSGASNGCSIVKAAGEGKQPRFYR
jgi:hypothetical protein